MRFAARACAALLALQLASAWSLQRPSLLGGGKASADPSTDDATPADARRRLASAKPTITFAEPEGPPPELDLEVLKPGPLPKISFEGWEKPDLPPLQKPEFDKPEPKEPPKITLVKPQKPNITWTAVTPPPQNWTIRPPEKVKGNVTIVKTKVFENVTKQVNVSKPAWNVNVTVVKGQKPDVRPYWQKPSANISITKFDKWTGYNFTYQKPPTNFSVTLQKPGKPKWGKEDGVFVKTEETKGVTINGTLEPPIMVGPVDDIIGERFVCVFPKGSEDWTTSFAKKVPAGLADAVASKDPNSFIAPPYGVKAFGPGCMTYDWMCRTNFGVPCSGHGVCESSQPNKCLCFAGYRNCLPPGMSNGCETNTYADNKNCLGCGYNFKTSTVNPQFICGNGTICCGLAGCVTPAKCNTTAATNATSLRTSIFPTPISAVKSPDGVPVSPPGDGADGAGSVATPTDPGAAGGDPAASSPPPPPPADGGSVASDPGTMLAPPPPVSSTPAAVGRGVDPDSVLPIAVAPGQVVSIPAVPDGMSAAEARAALAAAGARAAGYGGGLAGMGAGGDIADTVQRTAPAAVNPAAGAAAYGGAEIVGAEDVRPSKRSGAYGGAAPRGRMPVGGGGAMFNG